MRVAPVMRPIGRAFVAVVCLAVTAAGCKPDAGRAASDSAISKRASGVVDLTGAGATFPYPIYARWFARYMAATGVRINYHDIGSAAGIAQLSEQAVDFGATDSPMTEIELSEARGGNVIHLPMVVGAVAITYHLPGLTQPLRLTGATLADIYLGRITRWNDQKLVALNPDASLPSTNIVVVHRSDGSGTTFAFTDYLSAVSAAWRRGPGTSREVTWPAGVGESGNEGVSARVKQTPGAIGYVELAYATQNRLAKAALQNAAGEFVLPSPRSATLAAEHAVATLPPTTDYRVSIVNAPGAEAYPIASFTWLLMYSHVRDSTKARQLSGFVRWALSDGQAEAAQLDYAPLPTALAGTLVSRLDSLGFVSVSVPRE